MLDFGTDMDSREDLEQNDDLFAGLPKDEDVSHPAAAPEKTVEKPAKRQEEKAAEAEVPKRRPQLKPPTLPKYVEPASQARPQEVIKPELRNNPHFLHRRRKAEEFSTEDKIEVSRILKKSREAAGLTVGDVENHTQIRAHYITALEEAEYDNLPQQVYVLAYLRKLCVLYKISGEDEEHLVRPWRNITCELPENPGAFIQQDEENDNHKGLYRLEIILLAAAALIVIGLVTLIVVLVVSYFSGKDVPKTSFQNVRVLELQEKPALEVPEQPPAGTSRR